MFFMFFLFVHLDLCEAMGYAGDEFEARFGEICRKLAMQEGQE